MGFLLKIKGCFKYELFYDLNDKSIRFKPHPNVYEMKLKKNPNGISLGFFFSVLVQKLKDNCNESINLGHTVTITLGRVSDWYGKG
ncbi:hypothetical protein COI95_18195, partial [Bacillus cereus]